MLKSATIIAWFSKFLYQSDKQINLKMMRRI
jgi:hypothetical protein